MYLYDNEGNGLPQDYVCQGIELWHEAQQNLAVLCAEAYNNIIGTAYGNDRGV